MRAEAVRAVIVWAALQALLALTVLLAFAPLGALKAPIAYAIATAKATLVMWFFMELRREGGLPRLAAAATSNRTHAEMLARRAAAQRAYEADLKVRPDYFDGRQRPNWEDLSENGRRAWVMNPSLWTRNEEGTGEA